MLNPAQDNKAPFDNCYAQLSYDQGLLLINSISDKTGFIQFGPVPTKHSKNKQHYLCSAFPVKEIKLNVKEKPITQKSLLSQLSPYRSHLVAGLLPYELGYSLEASLTQLLNRQAKSSTLYVGIYDWCLCFDYEAKSFYLLADAPSQQTQDLIDALINVNSVNSNDCLFKITQAFTPDIRKADYLAKIEQVHGHILNGDCYQINLTQRFSAQYQGSPWEAYKDISSTERGDYCAYLNTGHQQVLSFSPEQFIEVNDKQITTKPIKGTSPTSLDRTENERYKANLADSKKDRSENLMIVDLLRNDLGKICETGSVTVPNLFEIQSFDYVHHLVSTITGKLRADILPIEALLSMFPGGSITGAPKIKAMEIIRELEDFDRNAYCGALFYATPKGYLNSNITIRTMLCQNDAIYCYGGGGIVADSNPEDEYAETLNKVKKFMDRLEKM